MWIKICGNTNLEDCRLAATLGANAVGFVFAPGKRTVTALQVAAIVAHLPPELDKIGVFTTGSFHEILATATQAGLTGVQLHGAFAPSLLTDLRTALGNRPGRRTILQVLHWHTNIPAREQATTFARQVQDVERNRGADAILIDSHTPSASGGTGTTFDWQAAQPILAQTTLPILVAGGLNPGNVAGAIAALHPWGVDVASGVEAAPGRKDPARLAAFLANARAATTSGRTVAPSAP